MKRSKERPAGIVRRMDALHRLVIPQEYCSLLRWGSGTPLEITRVGNTLVLTPGRSRCLLCGQGGQLVTRNGVCICRDCIQQFGTVPTAEHETQPSH